LAIDLLSEVTRRTVRASTGQIIRRVLKSRFHPISLADQIAVGSMMRHGLKRELGLSDVKIGTFKSPPRVKLWIAATDVLNGTSVWMPDNIAIEDAVIASSSIPGFFPPRKLNIDGTPRLLVDGGVVTNQPLTKLALDEHCGTIYACAVGYAGGVSAPPKNALDVALTGVSMAIHQTMKLEQALVEAKTGVPIQRIHPEMQISNFDFTPEFVAATVEESYGLTRQWLQDLGVCRRN
jgi:predicted acylesterase/phospholipase RssA